MPANNAFTGFTADGQNNGTMNVDGTGNWQQWTNNFGHNFWTSSSKTTTIYFPASGCRFNNNGSFRYVGDYGYYWSAVPSDLRYSCELTFGLAYVYPLLSNFRPYGFAARPVSE